MNAGDGCGCIFGIILVAAWTFDIHPIVGCIATIACICFAVWAMENTTPPPKTSTIIKNNNAQPKGNTQADSPLRLSITKNLCPTKKVNSEDFRHLLISHGIKYFYHFTDERNLDSIRKYGGLLSWKSCNTYGVDIPAPGGDIQSRQLDMRYNLQDYVRLSFCEDHPMAYRHKKDGKRLVLLKIKTDVALWENTQFSDINATDGNHFCGKALNDLKRVNFVAVKKTYVSREDKDFKHHQAEILVKTVIPKEFIINLDNPEYL
ncbi:MAG: DUF4433 domain-containing protein [Alistipes sp.]|nr:DUF4433 domain-containing protein [Alistipes sp.]